MISVVLTRMTASPVPQKTRQKRAALSEEMFYILPTINVCVFNDQTWTRHEDGLTDRCFVMAFSLYCMPQWAQPQLPDRVWRMIFICHNFIFTRLFCILISILCENNGTFIQMRSQKHVWNYSRCYFCFVHLTRNGWSIWMSIAFWETVFHSLNTAHLDMQ